MLVCKKCGKEFSAIVKIDGKHRALYSRKYCLECSPFGSKNTKKLDDPVYDGKLLMCKVCNREYGYTRASGHRQDTCNTCYTKKRRIDFKLKVVEIAGGKCSVCGYDKCINALEFHHKDATTKDFSLARGTAAKWELIEKEIDKCILVCANCHRELHYL